MSSHNASGPMDKAINPDVPHYSAPAFHFTVKAAPQKAGWRITPADLVFGLGAAAVTVIGMSYFYPIFKPAPAPAPQAAPAPAIAVQTTHAGAHTQISQAPAMPVLTPVPVQAPRRNPPAPNKVSYADAVGAPYGDPLSRLKGLYHCMLEREPDAKGLATNTRHWGTGPNVNAVRTFINFAEYRNKRKNEREFVRDLYQAMLGRNANETEIAKWTARLRTSRGNRHAVLDWFARTAGV